jgi:CENP-B N-terminal DNA-binding domain/Tc5 transposase DNA-binding domain
MRQRKECCCCHWLTALTAACIASGRHSVFRIVVEVSRYCSNPDNLHVLKMSSRKRKALTLHDKLGFLKEVDSNPHMTKVDLAKKLCVPVSTLNTIIYKRKEIENNASACGSSSTKKLRVQAGKFSELEDVLVQFFNQCRAANKPISGPILIEKARELSPPPTTHSVSCARYIEPPGGGTSNLLVCT